MKQIIYRTDARLDKIDTPVDAAAIHTDNMPPSIVKKASHMCKLAARTHEIASPLYKLMARGALLLGAFATTFMLVFAPATPALAVNSGFSRLAGNLRYDTMSAIADEYLSLRSSYSSGATPIVIVASGANYPDALAASGLAGLADAPIILTDPYTLSAQASAQISKLNPQCIIVVGGTSAVSDGVYNAISGLVPSSYITRIAGATRYETSLEILKQTVVNRQDSSGNNVGNWSLYTPTVVIASGANYADALSISSYSYNRLAPIVLCNPSSGLSSDAINAIASYGFTNAVIVGGTSAVPAQVENQLRGIALIGSNITRLSGATRYETSVVIAQYEMASVDSFSLNGVVFATGENFPDAIAAGPLAGVAAAPVMLVSGRSSAATNYCTTMKGAASRAYVVGGSNAVSDTLYNNLKSSLGF